MNEAIKLIALANDYKVVRAFEYLSKKLSKTLQPQLGSMINNLSCEGLIFSDEMIMSIIENNESEKLSEGDSITLSRTILYLFASAPELEDFTIDALENFPDDTKIVGTIITLGVVASLLLIVSSTEFEYKGKHFYIKKNKTSVEDIKAMSDLLKNLLPIKKQ
jgi:hypothetical protein